MSGAAEFDQEDDDEDDNVDEFDKVGAPAITQWLIHVPDHEESGYRRDKRDSQDFSQLSTTVFVYPNSCVSMFNVICIYS